MSRSFSLIRSLLALLLVLALAGCPPRTSRGDDDDDDSAADDDDATSDDDDATSDDDDDTPPDDDDATPPDDDDATPPDDDDFTGDDDDATPPLGSIPISGEYIIQYWADINAGVPFCEQHIEFSGGAEFGSGILSGCSTCDGRIDFFGFNDVSNPAADPDHCDMTAMTAAGQDIGDTLIDPAQYGDFGTPLGLVSSSTLASTGLDMTVSADTDSTSAGLESEYAGLGLDFTHGGFIEATSNSLATTAGLNAITNPEVPGSDYLAGWIIFLNPATNTYTGPFLDGEYGAQAPFVLTFDAEDFDGVSFSMMFEATP